jgi:Tfp pilus assembly protein PilF
LSSLRELEGAPPSSAAPADVELQLTRRYAFLSPKVVARIEGEDVVVTWPAEPESAQAAATDLFRQATEPVLRGDHEAAAALWRQVLQQQPSHHKARHNLARACLTLGKLDEAKRLLLNVLWEDPQDGWALHALAEIYILRRQIQNARGLSRLALVFHTGDAVLLNNLAALFTRAKLDEEAVPLFRAAIQADPALPNPRLGLAESLAFRREFQESAAAIEQFLATPRAEDADAAFFLTRARQLYAICQSDLADQMQPAAERELEQLLAHTQRLAGCPVHIVHRPDAPPPHGVQIRTAWETGRNYHVVECSGLCEEPTRLHAFSQGLLRVQAECQARQAGNGGQFAFPADFQHKILGLFDERPPGALLGEAFPLDEASARVEASAHLVASVLAMPSVLFADARLRQMARALRPPQFLTLCATLHSNFRDRDRSQRLLPPLLARADAGLLGVQALFIDWLFPRVTDFVERSRDLDGFNLALQLWECWQARFEKLAPGDEYHMGADFGAIAGLQGLYEIHFAGPA